MIANLLLALLLVSSPAAATGAASEPQGTSSMPGTNPVRADEAVTGPEATKGLHELRSGSHALIGGTATWYCGGGSPCTRGHSPSELIAAIDTGTGIERGEWVTVWHGDRSVTVRVVDVCACAGARIIDLSRLAFSRLADPSRGVIGVTLVPARGSQEAPVMTLPPTDTGGMP